MKHFIKFLVEANAVGSRFEQKTANAVQSWLRSNGLAKRYSAKRYQTISEDDGTRAEDYSDVVVEELKTGKKFFIECKQFERSNVINLQVDIKEDGKVIPVKGKNREQLDEAESAAVSNIINAICKSDGISEFIDFLNTRCTLIKGLKPAMFWSDPKSDDADRFLPGLISKYNMLVDGGKVEADCQKFDVKNLRQSTKNTLLCALCWRLSDPRKHTWDICKVDVPEIGKAVRGHYRDNKEIPVAYLQFGDKKLFRISNMNPLNLVDVPVFPEHISGQFSLKFTPRFGTGSIYVTPRSEIISDLTSDCSFVDTLKWPKIHAE